MFWQVDFRLEISCGGSKWLLYVSQGFPLLPNPPPFHMQQPGPLSGKPRGGAAWGSGIYYALGDGSGSVQNSAKPVQVMGWDGVKHGHVMRFDAKTPPWLPDTIFGGSFFPTPSTPSLPLNLHSTLDKGIWRHFEGRCPPCTMLTWGTGKAEGGCERRVLSRCFSEKPNNTHINNGYNLLLRTIVVFAYI